MREKLFKVLRLFSIFSLLLGLFEKLYFGLSKKSISSEKKIGSLKQRAPKPARDSSATNISTIA